MPHNKVSGFDFFLAVETGIPLCLDPCIVLCPLCVVTSNVRSRAPLRHADPPSCASPIAPSNILCHPQVLAVVFLDDLETSNISKNSCEVLSPAIDYPSSNYGSLALSRDSYHLRMARRRTYLARRQRPAVLGDCSS